jgi:hypothetical protein
MKSPRTRSTAPVRESAQVRHTSDLGCPWVSQAARRWWNWSTSTQGGGAGIQADLVTVDGQPATTEGSSEGVEGTAECGASPRAVVLGPEEVNQGIAAVALTCDGKIGDKGDCLAPVKLDRHAVSLDTRRPEQIQSKGGLHDTSFLPSVLETRRKVNSSEFRS